MKESVLRLLMENARLTPAEIALRLGQEEAAVVAVIKKLEEDKVIVGYQAVIDQSELPGYGVMAVIEVRVHPEREGGFDRVATRLSKFPEVWSLYLMSGGFDLQIVVRGDTLQEVATFVSSKLATIEGVTSTSTHFLLKKYKESGKLFCDGGEYERLKVSP